MAAPPRPLSAVRGKTTHLLRELQVVGVLLSLAGGERAGVQDGQVVVLAPRFCCAWEVQTFHIVHHYYTWRGCHYLTCAQCRASPGPCIDLTCLVESMI